MISVTLLYKHIGESVSGMTNEQMGALSYYGWNFAGQNRMFQGKNLLTPPSNESMEMKSLITMLSSFD